MGAAEPGYPYTDEWAFDCWPGGAVAYARQRVRHLDPDEKAALRRLLTTYADLIRVRHRAVHGVITLDPSLAVGKQWLVESARDGVTPLADLLAAMEDATTRLHRLVEEADELRSRIASRPSAADRRRRTPFREAEAALRDSVKKPRKPAQKDGPVTP